MSYPIRSHPIRSHPARRLPTLVPSCFVGLLALAWPALQQGGPVELARTAVAGNVHMLAGVGGFAGGNVAVSIGPDGLLLVDDQFDHQVAGILAAAAEVTEAVEAPVRFVVNTHFHGDHSGGNARLAETGAIVVAHDNVRARLASDPNTPVGALPFVTHADGLTLHVNGERVQLLHFEHGHTDGDSAVWFEGSRVLHLGDLFFQDLFPYIDRDSGGSIRGMYAAIDAVLRWLPEDARVIPGHGRLASVADLRAYRTMLGDAIDLVQVALDDGETLEQARAAGLLDAYSHLSWNFITTDRFLDGIWAELSAD